jgi:hypothetical protein
MAPWTIDEDETILIGIQLFGRSSFSEIGKLLPNRNTQDMKRRVMAWGKWKIRVRFHQ